MAPTTPSSHSIPTYFDAIQEKDALESAASTRDCIGRILFAALCPFTAPCAICVKTDKCPWNFSIRLPESSCDIYCAHIRTCNFGGACLPCCCDKFPRDATRTNYFLTKPEQQRMEIVETVLNRSARSQTRLSITQAQQTSHDDILSNALQ